MPPNCLDLAMTANNDSETLDNTKVIFLNISKCKTLHIAEQKSHVPFVMKNLLFQNPYRRK